VFDGGAYGGEALMATLKGGDKRLISYAVDLGTVVDDDSEEDDSVIREVHLRRGVLTARSARRHTGIYALRNVDAKAKTVIVEHEKRDGFRLVSPKPAETTPDAYRFEVKLAAAGSENLAVIEEHVFDTTHALANVTPDLLASFVQNKELSEIARNQLAKIAALKGDIAAMQREIQSAEKQRADIGTDLSRLQENIRTLNQVSGQQEQVQKYARALATSTSEAAALRDRIAELRKKQAAAETDLNRLIETLEF
jgi:hypothetical protein